MLGENVPSNGKFIEVAMLLLTGGRERSAHQYRNCWPARVFASTAWSPAPLKSP